MESVLNKENMNVIAEVELVYKNKIRPSEMAQITNSAKAYELFLTNWDPYRIEYLEQFKIMLLNRANRVLGFYEVSTGGISATVVDPKIVFTAALKSGATSLILAHNHPSGNTKPSIEDERLTRKLCEAGRLLEIKILDHIIVTADRYFSFSDEGLL